MLQPSHRTPFLSHPRFREKDKLGRCSPPWEALRRDLCSGLPSGQTSLHAVFRSESKLRSLDFHFVACWKREVERCISFRDGKQTMLNFHSHHVTSLISHYSR